MPVTTRLLRSSAFPRTLALRSILSTPYGMRNDKVDHTSVHYNGVTYFAFIDSTSFYPRIAAFNHGTLTTSGPTTLQSTAYESHTSPSVAISPVDQSILVCWSGHDAGTAYVAASTNPEDISAFGSPISLHAQLGASADYTYMSLLALGSDLYLFWRDYTGTYGRIAYSKSSDGGATWATRTLLATASGASGQVLYFRIIADTVNSVIHIFTTDNDRVISPSSLYHFYLDTSGAIYKSDGTLIVAAKPISPSASASLVKSSAGGAIDPYTGSVDASGQPAITFAVYDSGTPTNQIWVARWRTGAWQANQVGDTNGLVSGFRFLGAAAARRTTPDVVFFPRKVGSHFEMHRYTTTNDGVSWSGAALESGSSDECFRVDTPLAAAPGLEALWARGTLTSDSSFTTATKGYG